MADGGHGELTSAAKLVRVVLANCGPLSPTELAEEAYISTERAHAGLAELERRGDVEPVCGVCEAKEEVYELVDGPHPAEPSP